MAEVRLETSERDFDAIQRQAFAAMYARGARIRIAVIALLLVSLVVAQAITDIAPWRSALALSTLLLIAPFAYYDLAQFSKAYSPPRFVPMGIPIVAILLIAVVTATGALESPFLPLVPLFTIVAGVALGRRPALGAFVGLGVFAVWFWALGEIRGFLPDTNPSLFGGGVRAGHNDAHLYTTAIITTLLILVAALAATALRNRFNAMVIGALDAREDELAAHAAHSRELGVLAAEIAHELKNPLAGIKLLGDLVARDATGKDAERMGVLRHEVDRMQAILEEFLNFSRPLVPLSTVEADLTELCDDVAALHEGLARHKDIALTVMHQGPATVRCDPRKVRQVLINLVQNALDASPRGGAVSMIPTIDADHGQVAVDDRGHGLDPAVAARVWEPGVTTKDSGSGLGLTIAKALCHQHGGTLALVARDGGGTRALVRLPIGGVP